VRPTAIERAFELARSGNVPTVAAILTVLKREGYSNDQIAGRSLHRQLKVLIETARASSIASDPSKQG
jgi:hypothetical protein